MKMKKIGPGGGRVYVPRPLDPHNRIKLCSFLSFKTFLQLCFQEKTTTTTTTEMTPTMTTMTTTKSTTRMTTLSSTILTTRRREPQLLITASPTTRTSTRTITRGIDSCSFTLCSLSFTLKSPSVLPNLERTYEILK